MIPELEDDGHLPPGRFRCTVEEIDAAFVRADRFAGSSTRPQLFAGLQRYIRSWELVEDEVGVEVIKLLWIGGSFTSSILTPSDIDVSPVMARSALHDLKGRPGSGKGKALYEHRDRVKADFGVEPFAVQWNPFTTLDMRRLDVWDHEYVAVRGMMDDFWQRTVAGSVKQAMMEADADPVRGYLEVVV